MPDTPSLSFENKNDDEKIDEINDTDGSLKFLGESRRFTFEEDCQILEFIQKKSCYSKLKGLAVWRELSAEMDNKRSSLSLKGRFKISILAKIEDYCHELKLSEEVAKRFIQLKNEMIPKSLLYTRSSQRRPYTVEETKSKC